MLNSRRYLQSVPAGAKMSHVCGLPHLGL